METVELDYRFHIVRDGEEWKLVQQGNDVALLKARTRDELAPIGRLVAEQFYGQLVLHGEDGEIVEEQDYYAG